MELGQVLLARLGKCVDERVISFQIAVIGGETAPPVSLGRRSCGIVQRLDDCRMCLFNVTKQHKGIPPACKMKEKARGHLREQFA